MSANSARGCVRTLLVFSIVTLIGVALLSTAAFLAYSQGRYDGRRQGREEAFQVSGTYAHIDTHSIEITPTPANAQDSLTALPLAEQSITLNLCETLPVIAKEVLVHAEPGLTTPVTAALSQGTQVSVVCSSERLLQSVSWVYVAVERPNATTIIGWIPGQDIDYPPVCMQGRVKPKELALHDSDTLASPAVRTLAAGTEVGVICNSARGLWGREYWVRVKVIINGEIVFGWAPAVDVLE